MRCSVNRKIGCFLGFCLIFLLFSLSAHAKTQEIYRLYNPNSGEHFYTSNPAEKDNLLSIGWFDEGIGWYANTTGAPVYRLYNPNAKGGDHHYTTNTYEKEQLIQAGWHYDGSFWKSGGKVVVHVAWQAQALGKTSSRQTQIANIFNSYPDINGAYYYDIKTGQTSGKNQGALYTSASTYKLFIAFYVFELLNTAQLTWATPAPCGNVRAGFVDMIVNSGNSFSEWVVARYGIANIDHYLRARDYQGIGSRMDSSGSSSTSAEDLGKALKYCYDNAQDPLIDDLLNLMKTQRYRDGIPQGTGKLVADKVGFIWAIRNDTGIVYDENNPYILVLMTNGQGNFSLIRQAAQQVQALVSANP